MYTGRMKNDLYSDNIWTRVPKHKIGMEIMINNRGIKLTTKQKYYTNFLEFCNTMLRLGFNKNEILVFPTPTPLLAIYIIDCALIRLFINV